MDKLVSLYESMETDGVTPIHYCMQGSQSKAATLRVASGYGVFIDYGQIDTTAEELCLAAHEYGHVKTGTTHKIYSPYELVERHECRADKYAAKRIVPWNELERALQGGQTELWNLAEYFGVTSDFMQKSINVYQRMGKIHV